MGQLAQKFQVIQVQSVKNVRFTQNKSKSFENQKYGYWNLKWTWEDLYA